MANWAYVKDCKITVALQSYSRKSYEKDRKHIEAMGLALKDYVKATNEPTQPTYSLLNEDFEGCLDATEGNLPSASLFGIAIGRWSYKNNLEGYFGSMEKTWEWLGGTKEDYAEWCANRVYDVYPRGWREFLKLIDMLHKYNAYLEFSYIEIDEGMSFCHRVVGKYLPNEGLTDFDYNDVVPTTSDAMDCWGAETEDEANEMIQQYCDSLKGKDDDE